MVSVTISGVEELIAFLKEISSEKKADQVIEALANKTAKIAFRLAPEDTGEMEEDIRVEKDSEGYKVTCSVPWAFFNEFGSYNTPSNNDEKNPTVGISTSGKVSYRPFMRSAAYQALDEVGNIINSVFFGRIVSG
jgi:hypothetical protein